MRDEGAGCWRKSCAWVSIMVKCASSILSVGLEGGGEVVVVVGGGAMGRGV